MTVNVGKNQVHIGWWETGVIIVGIISCTWGASAAVNGYNNREKERDERQNRMFEKVTWIAHQDTMISQHLVSIDTAMSALRSRQDETDKVLNDRHARKLNADGQTLKYYNERNINGQLVLIPVTK